MSSAKYAGMSSRPTAHEKPEDINMDSFFDFNQGGTQPFPITAGSSKNDAISPFEKSDERQHFNGPSHDYNQYKQQVGLPVGSIINMPMNRQPTFDGYNSGIGDVGFDGGFASGWASGIDHDAEMGMDFDNPQSSMPAMFFPAPSNEASDNFINPNTIGGEEPTSSVGRLWPGMHSQQAQHAAMQKAAQLQAIEQRQMKLQVQQAQYRQVSQTSQPAHHAPSNGKRASHVIEPHVEESISRLLNQMRQQSSVSADDADSPAGLLTNIARMKKDEEEMDEDERLLASEEAKKLSSKERRQLRNKVSARAFRSRRKEYIGQLEGEVALKTQESIVLRQENTALMQENERYRGLIETLLRHPAFTPFINDISKDPSVLGLPQQVSHVQQAQEQQQQQPPVAPTQVRQHPQSQQQESQESQQHNAKPDYLNFDASQLQVPSQQDQQQHAGSTSPDETFSKMNLHGLQQSMNFNSYSVNAYAAGVPTGPDPVDLLSASPLCLRASCSTASTISAATSSSSNMTLLLAKLEGAARRLTAV